MTFKKAMRWMSKDSGNVAVFDNVKYSIQRWDDIYGAYHEALVYDCSLRTAEVSIKMIEGEWSKSGK